MYGEIHVVNFKLRECRRIDLPNFTVDEGYQISFWNFFLSEKIRPFFQREITNQEGQYINTKTTKIVKTINLEFYIFAKQCLSARLERFLVKYISTEACALRRVFISLFRSLAWI